MNLPRMPQGYYLMEKSGRWYVCRDKGGPTMRKLLDKDGDERPFDKPKDAAAYADRHAALKLKFNEVVPEVNDEN